MNRLAEHRVGRLHPRFAERRVRMDGATEFLHGQLGADSGSGLGNQFRGMGAYGSGPKQLAGGGIGDPLYKTARADEASAKSRAAAGLNVRDFGAAD